MIGAARTLDQADMDLQRAIDMFDTALTSKDERVVNALRSLMMIVALTDPETGEHDRQTGPLRAMERDLNGMHSRIRSLEDAVRQIVERDDSITRAYRRESLRPYDSTNPWAAGDRWTGNSVYMNDISKKLNGGAF